MTRWEHKFDVNRIVRTAEDGTGREVGKQLYYMLKEQGCFNEFNLNRFLEVQDDDELIRFGMISTIIVMHIIYG